MRFNFSKIASVLASAVMLGSTVGIAAAAGNYPAPFIMGGAADVAVVVGANAAFTDALAAGNLQTDLQAELARQTATGGSSTGASATGGDAVNLATGSQKLFWNSTLNAARTTLSKSDMKTLLADGTLIDDVGTSYTYTQALTIGNRSIAYSTSSGDLNDPILLIDVGTAAAEFLYRYKMTLNKNVNITNANVQGNVLNILGKDYTIGSDSTTVGTDALFLFSSGDTVKLNEGETATITVAGKEHTITVNAITQSGSTDKVSISVDGSPIREISEDTSSKVGGLDVFAKTVIFSAKETTTNSATLQVGSGKLKLTHGTTAATGSDETSVQNTLVTLTSDATTALLSAVQLDVALPSATSDWIKEGSSFVDPVFGGLKVQFASATPSLTAESRGKLVVDNDNSRNARATFTSDRSGKEKTFSYLNDQDTSDSTVTPILADTANRTIHVVENESIAVNEYTVINAGDNGRILKSTAIDSLATNAKVSFEDVLSGETISVTVGASGEASTTIDGQTYYLKVLNSSAATNLTITWGAASASGNAGTQITVMPRIKLKDGGWLVIAKPIFLQNNTVYSIPGKESLTTYESGTTVTMTTLGLITGAVNTSSLKLGNVNYTVKRGKCDVYSNVGCADATVIASATNATIVGVDVNQDGDLADTGDMNFNATFGGGILFIEQKKTTESGNSDDGDAVTFGSDTSGSTSPVQVSTATPGVTGQSGGSASSSGLQTWTSDSYTQSMLTRFGSYVKYSSKDNDAGWVYYPKEQMFVDVLFASDTATVTAGSAASSAVKELGSVIVKDSEVSSVSDKNLVVIGGSCINMVAAKVLGSDTPVCGADFTAKTGVGSDQFLVKAAASPYSDKKVALLVAGYEAADTAKAVTYVKTEKPKTDAGTEMKVSTTTLQTVA